MGTSEGRARHLHLAGTSAGDETTQTLDPCPTCHGAATLGDRVTACPVCAGTGCAVGATPEEARLIRLAWNVYDESHGLGTEQRWRIVIRTVMAAIAEHPRNIGPHLAPVEDPDRPKP